VYITVLLLLAPPQCTVRYVSLCYIPLPFMKFKSNKYQVHFSKNLFHSVKKATIHRHLRV